MIIRELKAYAKGDPHSSSCSFSPPHLQFMTKVYHCNVASNGAICECLLLDGHTTANACQVLMYVYRFRTRMALMLNILKLLKTAWSPALSLYKVILSLSSLLTDPNPADPLVPPIASEYRNNRRKHDATAREWVKKWVSGISKSMVGC